MLNRKRSINFQTNIMHDVKMFRISTKTLNDVKFAYIVVQHTLLHALCK